MPLRFPVCFAASAMLAALALIFVSAARPGAPTHRAGSLPRVNGKPLRATGAYQREYWYRYIRSLPLGGIPAGAEAAARQRASRFRLRTLAAAASGELAAESVARLATTWTDLGPHGIRTPAYGAGVTSGRTTCLLLQKGSNRIVLGAASGGIWRRSLSAGALFEPKSDFAESLSIGSLAADPRDPNIIYAGTGEAGVSVDSFAGAGLLKSTDGGDTWRRVDSGVFSGTKIAELWVDPANSARVLAGVLFRGLFQSLDGGVTWTRLLETPEGGIAFAVSPADRGRILYSNTTPYGTVTGDLLLSTDSGASFGPVNGPWKTPGVATGRIDLAFAPSNSSVVWASVAAPLFTTSNGLDGVYRSADGGRTWARVGGLFPGASEGPSWYCNPVAVHPTDPSTAYVGGVNLFRAKVGSAIEQVTHWFTKPGVPFIHADQHAIAFDPSAPGTIYAGNDGGIYVTRDSGRSWTHMNDGLATVQFYAGCVAAGPGVRGLYGGTQDNGGVVPTAENRWEQTIDGDGFQCAVDPQNAQIIYSTSYESDYYISNNGGLSFRNLPPLPFREGETRPFLTMVAIDPNDGSRIYGAAERVYRGISNRVSSAAWTAISARRLFATDYVYRVAPARSSASVLYASGGAGLARTRTGGDPWTRVDPPGGQFITGVAVHPANADYVVCARSGYSGGQVVRSRDGGATWSSVTANLPNIPANNVLLRLNGAKVDTYLATDTGVYYADLNAPALSWLPLGDGLPNAAVHDVLVANNGATVLAVTHGRGMWALGPLEDPSPRLASVTLLPASLRGRKRAKGTVWFDRPVTAASVVALASGDRHVMVPRSGVKVKTGKLRASFTIRTKRVTAPTDVTIRATFGGVRKEAILHLRP